MTDMLYRRLDVQMQRTVLISNRKESLSINYQVEFEEGDEDPQYSYEIVQRIIMQQLDAWEKEMRADPIGERKFSLQPPPITSAMQMLSAEDEKSKKDTKDELQKGVKVLCPECGEKMRRIDGKRYYQCSRHWATPEMLQQGEAKVIA